jgi:hypothetical protein
MDVQKRREWLKSQPGSMCFGPDHQHSPSNHEIRSYDLCADYKHKLSINTLLPSGAKVVQTQDLTSWVNCAVLCCFCGVGGTMVGTSYLGPLTLALTTNIPPQTMKFAPTTFAPITNIN